MRFQSSVRRRISDDQGAQGYDPDGRAVWRLRRLGDQADASDAMAVPRSEELGRVLLAALKSLGRRPAD